MELDVEISKPEKMKSPRQLGYWHAEILPKCTRGLYNVGYKPMDTTIAGRFLLAKFHVDEFMDEKTGEILRVPKRLSDTTEEEMTTLIDFVIDFAKEYLGERIVPPQEYYERLEKAGRLTDEQRLRLDEIREFNN